MSKFLDRIASPRSLRALLFWLIVSGLAIAWAVYRVVTQYNDAGVWEQVVLLGVTLLWVNLLADTFSRVIRKDYTR